MNLRRLQPPAGVDQQTHSPRTSQADRSFHPCTHQVPINLPENDLQIYSHARLILEGLAVYGG